MKVFPKVSWDFKFHNDGLPEACATYNMDDMTIRLNPLKVTSPWEYAVTLLHEVRHHLLNIVHGDVVNLWFDTPWRYRMKLKFFWLDLRLWWGERHGHR
jgi:hypothetical protein